MYITLGWCYDHYNKRGVRHTCKKNSYNYTAISSETCVSFAMHREVGFIKPGLGVLTITLVKLQHLLIVFE
jgi:hypothetical protein